MKSLLIVISLVWSIASIGQGTVTYHEDQKITDLMNAYRSYTKLHNQIQGYRVQVSFSNDRQEAYNGKAKLYRDFPSEKCYVVYDQPYYKLRVGDYTSKLEAHQKMQMIQAKYQGAFVVKDHIKTH
jgi:SPOR domain